jgi:DNA-directed RNA polymerase specialized sigma subunit
LQFEFINFGTEQEHLKQHTEKEKENLSEKVKELDLQGRSLREIGAELGISHMKVSRILRDCNTM